MDKEIGEALIGWIPSLQELGTDSRPSHFVYNVVFIAVKCFKQLFILPIVKF